MLRLLIIGAGGFGQTVKDVASQTGRFNCIHFLDDNSHLEDVVAKCDEFQRFINEQSCFLVALGNNALRRQWLEMLAKAKANIATLIHPSAYVSPSAGIAEGCIVLPQAVVNTSCILKRGCIVNIGALVDHGCILEECVHVAPGGIVKAENRIPALLKIESGEVVSNRQYPL